MISTFQADGASAKANSFLTSDLSVAWLLAAAAVLLQMLTNGRCGYFRDELYFLACSDHLAWGYVDFAPLVVLAARVSRLVLGDSLHAIRALPALAQGHGPHQTGLSVLYFAEGEGLGSEGGEALTGRSRPA